jgi:hypothetical protein
MAEAAGATFKAGDWADVTPISLEEGPDAVVKIAYSDECGFRWCFRL